VWRRGKGSDYIKALPIPITITITMEAYMWIKNDGENCAVYLVYKLFEDQNTPMRQFLGVMDSKEEAEKFART